ncbi:MAG: hypothetical protein U1E14_18630 [Geminicoccaceae bacterium]
MARAADDSSSVQAEDGSVIDRPLSILDLKGVVPRPEAPVTLAAMEREVRKKAASGIVRTNSVKRRPGS